MKIKNTYLKVYKQGYLLLETALNYSLFALFVFFFVWVQPSALASTTGESIITHKHSIYHSSQNLFYSLNNPFYSHFEPAATDNETEDDDENERSFDEENTLIEKDSYESPFNICSSLRNQFLQLKQSLQNRSTVSLFILQHSWKSFLI